MMENVYVGIDVSKDRLDVHILPEGEAFAVSRDAAALETLVDWLKSRPVRTIAVEATGRFETFVAADLAAAGLPVVVVNPAHVRSFAKALGKRAKTDPIDTLVIARFVEPPSRSSGPSPMRRPGSWPISWPGAARSSR